MKLWLVHVEPFHRHTIPRLAEQGIDVTYACSVPERLRSLEAPVHCIAHSAWDAMRGRLPESVTGRAGLQPPSAALLEKLAPGEATALLMLDRLTWKGLRVQQLRRVYLDYVAMWNALFEIARPDAVVFHTVPHAAYDYVLYLLCRLHGIGTLIVERTSIPDRLILLDDLEGRPRAPAEALGGGARAQAAAQGKAAGRDYYDMRNRVFRRPRGRRFSRWDFARLAARGAASFAWQFVKRPLQMRDPMYSSLTILEEPVPSTARFLWRYFLATLFVNRLRVYYESHTIEPDLAADYVYFPLHHQPERSSLPMGLHYSDLLLALGTLVAALPTGWRVYVKEHPRQFLDNNIRSRQARDRGFYERLLQHERVCLISPHVPPEELVARSRCTATVAGTAGWEAVQQGVPAIVFGTPWYRHCPGVELVASVADCAAAFRRIQSGECRVDPKRVQAYRDWIANEGGFRGYPSVLFTQHSGLSPEENGRSFADAIAQRLKPAVPIAAAVIA